MDIKEKISEIITKVQNDKDFAAKFQKNPTGAVESILGVDLPDDQVNAVIEAVKAKIAGGDLMNMLTGFLGGKKD